MRACEIVAGAAVVQLNAFDQRTRRRHAEECSPWGGRLAAFRRRLHSTGALRHQGVGGDQNLFCGGILRSSYSVSNSGGGIGDENLDDQTLFGASDNEFSAEVPSVPIGVVVPHYYGPDIGIGRSSIRLDPLRPGGAVREDSPAR